MAITLNSLKQQAQDANKIVMLTCYDASFAKLMENAGVEVLLVGDSLGFVLQGHSSTLPVTQQDMEYHVACVARGASQAFIIGDMAFGTYQESPQQALRNATRLMAAGAHMVKLEGGDVLLETVKFLSRRGIPVCGHLGLLPQSANQLGGYRVQGKSEESAQQLLKDAAALEQAGIDMLVLEAIPAPLGKAITAQITIPTIGIGAGPSCSGQVLVSYDMLGIYSGRTAKFVKNFMADADDLSVALKNYVYEVKSGEFPAPAHCYT